MYSMSLLTLTTVWTMNMRCRRILSMQRGISTVPWSLARARQRSRAINVPVLPTPALHKRNKHRNDEDDFGNDYDPVDFDYVIIYGHCYMYIEFGVSNTATTTNNNNNNTY